MSAVLRMCQRDSPTASPVQATYNEIHIVSLEFLALCWTSCDVRRRRRSVVAHADGLDVLLHTPALERVPSRVKVGPFLYHLLGVRLSAVYHEL